MNFKKQFLFYSLRVLMVQSCIMAETYSEPQRLFLQVEATAIEDILVGFRHPKKIVDSEQNENLFIIDIPRMDGGFSQLFGQRFMEHNPLDYKNILIYEKGLEIKKLSLNDVYKLDKIVLDSIELYHLILD